MKTYMKLQLALIAILLLWFVNANAITMNVSTSSTVVGETVTVSVTGVFSFGTTPPPYGSLSVDFGDGSPVQTVGGLDIEDPNLGITTHTLTRAHIYAAPGTYTITGTGVPGAHNLAPPLSVTQTIIITDPVDSTLPRGEVGVEYDHLLLSAAGIRTNTYRLFRGKLPPGLILERNGRITGVPAQKGAFPFTIQITSSRGSRSTQDLIIHIDPGVLVIRVTPDIINATRGGSTNQKVTFTVVSPTVQIRETIRSTRGEFLAGGRIIGSINRPMSINLNTPRPSASETITIPNSVLQAAQNVGTTKIMYRRAFTAQNLRPGAGDTKVSLRTSASGELRITKLRIFFEQNNRPIILVERNSRDLDGGVEIHYNGSGTLKGFWKVDERIIERVQKNVFYGKVLTLKTPKAPPLPTYSEGAHRLQFIITEPESALQRIDFPEAIYHVEAKRAEIIVPLTLNAPDNQAELSTSGETFAWSEAPQVATYHVEFFENDADEAFFTAYTKKGAYVLAEKLISLKFASDKSYRWRVRGFTTDGELNAESQERHITFKQDTAFVPNQVIFIVDDNEQGRGLIPKIVEKYDLQIVEQTSLVSINRIMVICTTDSDVMGLSAQLQQEDGLYGSQPNYIFSTMTEQDPLSSMQSINKLIDLDAIHQKSSGKNILIAIIDTGIDLDHQDLKGRIRAHGNFVVGSAYRGEVHGTAVAGIIAGIQNDFGIIGIAPDAELLAYRACEQESESKPQGTCYSASIAKALDAAILAKANITNLSLGSETKDNLIASLISKGYQQGIFFIAPVGNDTHATAATFPASHPEVTSVAGFDEHNNPLPNREIAMTADAIAPARNIFSTTPGNKHNFLEGTSLSAATISGIIALSLEKNNGDSSRDYPHFDEKILWQNQVATYIGM